MNKIIALAIAFLGSSILFSGCIKETFPEGGGATIGQKPGSFEDATAPLPTILITNYTNAGDHYDHGFPGIFGGNDRMIGEVFPCSSLIPGGNQYYDRWQSWLYPGQTLGLGPGGAATRFIYLNYYQYIYTANELISVASLDERMGVELGIAKAFRASYYLDLARLYDPLPAKAPDKPSYEAQLPAVKELTVPISREGMTLEEYENNPRATREEIFTFIFEDLNAADSLLEGYTPAQKNFPSRAVVLGLKARAYLWLGGFSETYANIPTGNEAYRLAAQYAREAITESGAAMMTESEWTDPKTGFNTVVSSWMWAMIQSANTVLNNLLSYTAHMAPDGIWGYGNGSQPGISNFSYDRINNGDFRKKLIVSPDRNYAAIAPYINLTEEEFEGGGGAVAVTAPYVFFKFKPNGGEKRDFTIGNVTSIPMMRVEEMYLIEAEATAHTDAATGKSMLETFMANRCPGYAVPGSADLIDEIIFQKRIEFWGEGIMVYDFKRLNMSMHNGDPGNNAPSGARLSTDGRAPWWNLVIPLSAEQQNNGMKGLNNPDPTQTVFSES